jgi:uncharacterized membrane protein
MAAFPQRTDMNHFTDLLQRHPLVFFHLVTAFGALLIGTVVMLRRKGTGSHRAWGWAFVVLMCCTALASGFIRDYRLPNLAGFTPIHFFTAFVLFNLPRGIWFIRQGNVVAHRKTMRGLFIGGCIVAGIFTLLPGRFLGRLLWQGLGLL